MEFLFGGLAVLVGVIVGGAVVNITNFLENRHERLDTPEEKANRLAYQQRHREDVASD